MPKVLVADDSAVARVSVARRVRALGFEVVERDSAASASTVDPASLACALLDLDLGDGSGADVAERLRTAPEAHDLPIAFFTSTREGVAFDRAKRYGEVFSKPDELEKAVAWVTQATRKEGTR
jgi:CheY-like chemotaxis protein